MNIEQIPADELFEMSELWHRAFNAAGCNPMCHCCHKMIAVGEKFKLATISKLQAIYRYPVDVRMKLKERKGEEITEKDLWNAHNVSMRYADYFRWSKDNKMIDRKYQNESVTYDQYINNTDRPNSTSKDKTVFYDSDIERWEKIKEDFKDISKEVMLCETCSPAEYTVRENRMLKSEIKEFNKPKGGCFRINGKIIH